MSGQETTETLVGMLGVIMYAMGLIYGDESSKSLGMLLIMSVVGWDVGVRLRNRRNGRRPNGSSGRAPRTVGGGDQNTNKETVQKSA